jgi:hypothetical protein
MSLQKTWLRSHRGTYVACVPNETSNADSATFLLDEVGDKMTINSLVAPTVSPCPVRVNCKHVIFNFTNNVGSKA